MDLRWSSETDAPELAAVFYRAVREGPSPYSEDQRRAWVSDVPDARQLWERLAPCHVAVACDAEAVVGFMASDVSGYIDLVFILPEARGRGLFRKLYGMIEAQLRADGVRLLRTHASLLAEPAFAALGFSVIERETVERAGVGLPRAKMEKRLT